MDLVAARLLDSPRAVDQAWGAYYAGRLRLAELGPKLVERLAAPAGGGSPQVSDALRRGLLGAAIECDVEVPVQILRRYESRWPAETLILLARVSANEAHLLELRETAAGDAAWFAINNLLLQQRSSRHLRRILSELDLVQAVTVMDGPARSGGGIASCQGGGLSGIRATDPKGFPPAGSFGLVINPGPGDRLLAEGPQNAYYRYFPFASCPGGCIGWQWIDRKASAVRYFAWMLREPESDLRQITERHSRIQWAGRAAYRTSIRGELASQEAAIRSRINRLNADLRRDLPGLALRVQVRVRDDRKRSTEPLPVVAAHTFTLAETP